MNTCAIMISPNCSQLIYKRGICSNCWNYLIENGLIQKGEPFPEWLEDMVRIQDTFDNSREEELAYVGDFEELGL